MSRTRYPGGIGLPFSMGQFGHVPDPPEYPEFEGCPFDYSDIDEGDECIGCVWHETCKAIMSD